MSLVVYDMRKTTTLVNTRHAISRQRQPVNYPVASQTNAPYATAQFPDSLTNNERISAPAHSAVKRSFDVIVAALGLVVLLPCFLAIALAIKVTSRGPFLFSQLRYGLDNKMFVIYKFRTIYIDKTDITGVEQICKNDERLIPIGTFLRRFNLDELPQLLNVLKGDMSLVGPRPHVPGMLAAGVLYEALVPNYFERHRVKPGITGLAQAWGFRGSTTDAALAKARIEFDLKYIEEWSFALDLLIIAKTVWTEITKGGNGI